MTIKLKVKFSLQKKSCNLVISLDIINVCGSFLWQQALINLKRSLSHLLKTQVEKKLLLYQICHFSNAILTVIIIIIFFYSLTLYYTLQQTIRSRSTITHWTSIWPLDFFNLTFFFKPSTVLKSMWTAIRSPFYLRNIMHFQVKQNVECTKT